MLFFLVEEVPDLGSSELPLDTFAFALGLELAAEPLSLFAAVVESAAPLSAAELLSGVEFEAGGVVSGGFVAGGFVAGGFAAGGVDVGGVVAGAGAVLSLTGWTAICALTGVWPCAATADAAGCGPRSTGP